MRPASLPARAARARKYNGSPKGRKHEFRRGLGRGAQKRRPGPRGTGPFQCALLVTGGESETGSPHCRAAKAAACTAGVSPTEAAYSSPHVQSELVTDHLHFGRANRPRSYRSARHGARGLAKPSRVDSRVTASRFGGDSRRDRDADFSRSPLLPAAGLFLPATPGREHFPEQNAPRHRARSASAGRPSGS